MTSRSLPQRAIRRFRADGVSGFARSATEFGYATLYRNSFRYAPSGMKAVVRWYTDVRSTAHYTDADPFKIVWVDPREIEYSVAEQFPIVWGEVDSGDWYKDRKPFEQTDVYQGTRDYLETGDSSLLENHFERSYAPWSGLDDLQFDDWLENFDAMVDSIKKEGYKTQLELRRERPNRVSQWNNEFVASWLNDIVLYIGPDGELLWATIGQHRLSVAKCVGVNKVAVRIAKRHADWQCIRDQIRHADSIQDIKISDGILLRHPDLNDIYIEK